MPLPWNRVSWGLARYRRMPQDAGGRKIPQEAARYRRMPQDTARYRKIPQEAARYPGIPQHLAVARDAARSVVVVNDTTSRQHTDVLTARRLHGW